MQEYPFPVVMPYEYLISVGECQWGDLYIHDYRSRAGSKWARGYVCYTTAFFFCRRAAAC